MTNLEKLKIKFKELKVTKIHVDAPASNDTIDEKVAGELLKVFDEIESGKAGKAEIIEDLDEELETKIVEGYISPIVFENLHFK